MMQNVKKYEIWLVDLNPTKGSEQSGVRPCIVFQNNLFYQFQKTTLIIPITSNVKHNGKFRVLLENFSEYGLLQKSAALCFQLRTIDKERCVKKLGEIRDEEVKKQLKYGVLLSIDSEDDFEE